MLDRFLGRGSAQPHLHLNLGQVCELCDVTAFDLRFDNLK